MTEEVQTLAEVDSAPVPEATAAPEEAQNAPEVVETPPEPQPEEKKFTQAELDTMIGKRLAREQRKWEREQSAKLADLQAKQTKEVAPLDEFESPEQYAEALAEQKAQQLIAQRDAQRHRAAIDEAYHEREEEARVKYDDFEQIAYNPRLPITNVMAETIKASDTGPDLAYYLGSNPKEAERISRLSPFLQAKELGKIEVKLASDPPSKKVSSAPAPIAPVTSRNSGTPTYDTTDPRAAKSLNVSDWIEAERQRQIRKLEARNR